MTGGARKQTTPHPGEDRNGTAETRGPNGEVMTEQRPETEDQVTPPAPPKPEADDRAHGCDGLGFGAIGE